MKRSRKISTASIAALSLPLVGAGVAAGQQAMASPAPVVADSGYAVDTAIRSSTAQLPVTLAAMTEDAEAPGIDPMRGWSEDDFAAYAAYWDAGYNYAQVLALAEEWNMSEFEVKAQAGNAILAGDTSSFDALVEGIAPFPQESENYDPGVAPSDSYWAAGYDYDDAVLLAEAWNTDTYQAKILAGEMIDEGNLAEIEAVLGQG